MASITLPVVPMASQPEVDMAAIKQQLERALA